MDIDIQPRYPDIGEGKLIHTFIVPTKGSDDYQGGWYDGLITITLLNNSPDRLERIIGTWVELKARRLFFWRRTIAKGEAKVPDPQRGLPYGQPITDLPIQPMAAPIKLTLTVGGSVKEVQLPRKFDVVLVLRMAGPIKKIERRLITMTHDPKR